MTSTYTLPHQTCTLSAGVLKIAYKQTTAYIPLPDIREVRLVMSPAEAGELYNCYVKTAEKTFRVGMSTVYVGHAPAHNQQYRAFVRDLHAALQAAGHPVAYRQGMNYLKVILQVLAVVAVVASLVVFVATPAHKLLKNPFPGIALFFTGISCWLWGGRFHVRTYDPGNIPAPLLPV
ncbi:MAG: hypothetical protein KF690_02070 [Bacteroidetes bacterium]|nr:hypothetical protein [Bacteroidota bacterium]